MSSLLINKASQMLSFFNALELENLTLNWQDVARIKSGDGVEGSRMLFWKATVWYMPDMKIGLKIYDLTDPNCPIIVMELVDGDWVTTPEGTERFKQLAEWTDCYL